MVKMGFEFHPLQGKRFNEEHIIGALKEAENGAATAPVPARRAQLASNLGDLLNRESLPLHGKPSALRGRHFAAELTSYLDQFPRGPVRQ
jgi:hypothetical protein